MADRVLGDEQLPLCARTRTAFCVASLDGFKGEGTPIAYSFLVRDPDANWVANNLLEGMCAETLHDGFRVHVDRSHGSGELRELLAGNRFPTDGARTLSLTRPDVHGSTRDDRPARSVA